MSKLMPEEIVSKKDGMRMVLIPAGEFQMGGNGGGGDELPVHTVYLDDYYMDVHPVTNAQYQTFLDANATFWRRLWRKRILPRYSDDPELTKPDHPVVGVSWFAAKAYCRWSSKRLPTEAEWEKAARGGLVGKVYPWGNSISHDQANYFGTGGKDIWERTSPVCSFDPNDYGLYDMIGNVCEWCADYYDNWYYERSQKRNPRGPSSGSMRVLRGGCWGYDEPAPGAPPSPPSYLRVSDRDLATPESRRAYYGFRCVKAAKH